VTISRSDDRIAISEMIYTYAEAVDILGCHPARPGEDDPALPTAAALFRRCMIHDAAVQLYFEGSAAEPTHAPAEGPQTFANWVREYFTSYGYIGTYHLAGNVRPAFTGTDTADVTSLINSTHWLADGRILLAPIVYRDKARRDADGTWKITARELVVQRWWIAEGYFPVPTDPTLARPA
jgi:hypothetical protein